jgi:DNA polymerase lambda
VKEAFESGKLRLERNQYIGLDCYDDIQEEMVRSEVEQIGAIIADTFKMRYPSAEITIMGSYRRGKPGCGDVDILISHPVYYDDVPPQALRQFVSDLLDQGHISHHLTFISGMDHNNYVNFPKSKSIA